MGTSSRQVRDPERARAAHLLRRTALGVHPDRVTDLAGTPDDEAVSALLNQTGSSSESIPRTDEWTTTTDWWIEQMVAPNTGLTDRMAWFWHGLLTTNAYKVNESSSIADQLKFLRENARSDFRTLLHGFVTSGALLDYLDASWSIASNPNENLARELMELFTIGRSHYSEDDVRAGARALAGWVVEDGVVEFRRENAFIAPLIFLGEQAEWNTELVVDRLCDHPATAARISARLWQHLVGVTLAEDSAAELGTWWQQQDLQIEPLIERIVGAPAFWEHRLARPRTGIEWYCGARSAVGDSMVLDSWRIEGLGQMPYLPPSVAGWPNDNRWLGPGSLVARAALSHDIDYGPQIDQGATTQQILDQCSLFEVSDATVAALDRAETVPDISPESVQLAKLRLALTSPEFNLL